MQVDPYDPIYTIGIVARLLNLHEQTLRQYERLGLVSPCRSIRKTRLYCQVDVSRLECINYLVKTCGVNLAGVQILVHLSSSNPQIMQDLLDRNFSGPSASNEHLEDKTYPEEPRATKRIRTARPPA
jgi:MerR family transcriptional regulator, heat shock protein HspR